jgi:hypothetical protein
MNWAMGARTDGVSAQCVLFVVADTANEHGVSVHADPDYIAARTRQSRATVFRRLRELEAVGALTRLKRFRDDGAPMYEIKLNLDATIDYDAPPDDGGTPQDIEAESQIETPPQSQIETPKVSPVRQAESHSCDSKSPSKNPLMDINSAQAREPLISEEAKRLADDCVIALGFEPEHPPIELAGLAYQTAIMLARGYDPPRVIAAFARFAGQHPIKPLSYFVKVVETACTAPPLTAPSTENPNGRDETIRNGFVGRIGEKPHRSNRSAKEQRWAQAWDNVEGRLGVARSDADGTGDETGEATAGRLPEPRRP